MKVYDSRTTLPTFARRGGNPTVYFTCVCVSFAVPMDVHSSVHAGVLEEVDVEPFTRRPPAWQPCIA